MTIIIKYFEHLQFLEERLDLINKGEATSDEFEMEVSLYNDKPRKNFQQVLTNAKKDTGAFVKNLKNKASHHRTTANASSSKQKKVTFVLVESVA